MNDVSNTGNGDRSPLVEIIQNAFKDASVDKPALRFKHGGAWTSRTFPQIKRDVASLVGWLREVGVNRGDHVAILSENRYEWIVADLALVWMGAVSVPLHVALAAEQIATLLDDCGAKAVCVSASAFDAKIRNTRARHNRAILVFGEPASGDDTVPRFDQVVCEPEVDLSEPERSTTSDLVTLLYTSGTTGESKGVMLTHGNLGSNVLATIEAFGPDPNEVRFNLLPFSHIFARTCDLYTWVARQSLMTLVSSRETAFEDLRAARPTFMNAVPYIYETARRAICSKGEATPEAVRAFFGGELRIAVSGGAPLPNELFDFFAARDLPILQGYGLTESSPVISMSTRAWLKRGSVGKLIPGVEVAISDSGEILTRGPHVMKGYRGDGPGTSQAISTDGWLATGDLGHMDEEGFLYVTGRRKEILVTAAGKKASPTKLESLLSRDPFILQAMVIGNGRSCLSALIVPELTSLRAWFGEQGLSVSTDAELTSHKNVLSLFEGRIADCLRECADFEQVRRFRLLPRAFSIELGELTPKQSLRRATIEEHFRDTIEEIYSRSSTD